MSYQPLYRQSSFESDQSSPQADLLSEKQNVSNIALARSRISPRILSDFTIGLSDGLTVPFALTAGLSALGDGKIVVFAGLAELVAGAISMGVAGYLAAKGEQDAQIHSSRATRNMITTEPEEALAIARARFQEFALPVEILDTIIDHYSKVPSQQLFQTLMQFERNESEAPILRPWLSGMTIGIAYFIGGFVPLVPYILASIHTAFTISVIITATVLFTFGYVKAPLAGCSQGARSCLRSGMEMLVLGGLAAGAALMCVKALNNFPIP